MDIAQMTSQDNAQAGEMGQQYLATGATARQLVPLLRNYNAGAAEFKAASDRLSATELLPPETDHD